MRGLSARIVGGLKNVATVNPFYACFDVAMYPPYAKTKLLELYTLDYYSMFATNHPVVKELFFFQLALFSCV